jgi:levanase
MPAGTTVLPASGAAVQIDATLAGGSANNYGVAVRTGNGQATLIGYNRANSQLYIDRTRSGNVNFDPSFSGIHTAPLPTVDGVVHLTILVDWSSVEVFGQDGQVLLTDQIFPDSSSVGIAAFADGGSATLRSLTVNQMRSAWDAQSGPQSSLDRAAAR